MLCNNCFFTTLHYLLKKTMVMKYCIVSSEISFMFLSMKQNVFNYILCLITRAIYSYVISIFCLFRCINVWGFLFNFTTVVISPWEYDRLLIFLIKLNMYAYSLCLYRYTLTDWGRACLGLHLMWETRTAGYTPTDWGWACPGLGLIWETTISWYNARDH